MKKIIQLTPVSSFEQVTDLGAMGRTVWHVHTLVDGCGTEYRHWNRQLDIPKVTEELVVCKIGKAGRVGKAVGRMVKIC